MNLFILFLSISNNYFLTMAGKQLVFDKILSAGKIFPYSENICCKKDASML